MKLDYLKACKQQYKLDRHLVISYDESYPFIFEGSYALELQGAFFFKDQQAVMQGTVQGRLNLLCQNCLQPFTYELQHTFELYLLRSATTPLPQTAYYVCTDSYLDLQQLIKEEVLFSIPSLPKHCTLQ